jgi:hypothetical protein
LYRACSQGSESKIATKTLKKNQPKHRDVKPPGGFVIVLKDNMGEPFFAWKKGHE